MCSTGSWSSTCLAGKPRNNIPATEYSRLVVFNSARGGGQSDGHGNSGKGRNRRPLCARPNSAHPAKIDADRIERARTSSEHGLQLFAFIWSLRAGQYDDVDVLRNGSFTITRTDLWWAMKESGPRRHESVRDCQNLISSET
ncbi:MAG: cbb3-type cytochrome oxidase assembly protein [Mesorhizobium sp.]|nr:MAG: cbb3-type cytochrome oxidase assembly protein [Mesorhizobium sp.]